MQVDQYDISADGEPEDRNKLWVETNSWNSCFFEITSINWGRPLCNEKVSPCPPTLYAFIVMLYAIFPSFTWEEPHLTAMFLWTCSFFSFPTSLFISVPFAAHTLIFAIATSAGEGKAHLPPPMLCRS